MRHTLPIVPFALVATVPSPSHAAKAAADWPAFAKTNEGRSVTLAVLETGSAGAIASDAPYAVVPVTPVNAAGVEMPEIPVLMAAGNVPAYLKSVTPEKTGKRGAFGSKVVKKNFTGTFVTLAGEPAIVIGEIKPAMKLKKPSAVLAAQLAAAKKTASEGETVVREESRSPVRRDSGPKAR